MRNAEANHDILGSRGEDIFSVLITKFHPTEGYLFQTHFLGDKWPGTDFIVELLGAGPGRPFFFVQIKSTRQGYTAREGRLKVRVAREDVISLATRPVPTYLVGIDEVRETGYIISANGEHLTALSSLSTAFAINASDHANRRRLWDEVMRFWSAPPVPKLVSHFADSSWR